jgi:hypothetical protein
MRIIPTTCIRQYDGSRRVAELSVDNGELGGGSWQSSLARHSISETAEEWHFESRVACGAAVQCAAGVRVEVSGWERANYLLIPGVVYAGNRFESRRLGYPPKHAPADCKPDTPTLIADIPRLEMEGPSRIQLLAGGMVRPAVAAFDPASRSAWILLAPANAGDFVLGFDIRESDNLLEIAITAPGVREQRYEFMNASAESHDRAADFATGEGVSFHLQLHRFPCADVSGLFDRLFELRRMLLPEPERPSAIPMKEAFKLVEEHYNRDFWWEEAGLYGTERVHENHPNPYQTGWCGGIIAQYALLAGAAGEPTRSRCLRHLDTVFTSGIAPSGLFFGKYAQGAWRSDCWFEDEDLVWRRPLTLVRRQGDALFYALSAFDTLEQQGHAIPARWLEGAHTVAETLVRIWQKHGQFGQWLDQFTGEVVIGNSASGAIIPAALCAAEKRFGGGGFLHAASDSVEWLYQNFTRIGITTGGPGDALQCPDSESAYALVESYMALHESTGGRQWLDRAGDAARQFASWVMPYDYRFPADSLFGRLGIRSAGAVFANSQNGHAAPGICTHAGSGLVKLSQATGDARYRELALEIAGLLPQCLSTAARSMVSKDGQTLPPGWINERVNTSDWDNNVGGVFHGPCWCEVSLLLTVAGISGI